MGRVASRLSKPIRTFNIENRARRVLDKQQKEGIASPKHPSSLNQISQLQNDNKELFTQEQQRNELLHENLKGLYVESDSAPKNVKNSTSRPLPESRETKPETEFGSMETYHTIPEGRANLRMILNFVSQHQVDPDKVTVDLIADEYKLSTEDVVNILKHFKTFNLHIPQEMYKKNKNMKKIVADQIKASANSTPGFQLSLPKEDVNPSKT